MKADLSSVPESAFVVEERSCECCGVDTVLQAAISIVMSVASADLKFELMFGGECYGKTRMDYHHDGLMPPSDDPGTDLQLFDPVKRCAC